ncbi:TPA: DNA mismatch repair protein MutS [Candidatus Gastranaerophilales bacterium HUM_6]|nr:dNA mismatch repair protein MutS [Fusobacterium sp. CAG:815]DAA93240.1 MAG TPA: DNA mismatch repair protein MutS [Candidatus Gastranaerophilales bacterium HUM_6]DAA93495.1 MAG TPA: DNA mismatch repair protein MutS [Candidatus Gastranaerophilales bacterium HUM_7]DAB02773.1 MAG TPA: DNA mismatch repair protein MutS [Candidatus Gastranaerophilales bacterium HUM_12]DAB09165.1 MAG TPA: DNA mismatch repair protein MutS [Candidatus Gastranaerophilales bacterium HUM_14]
MSKTEINHIKSWEVNLEDTTPVMQQYLKIKQENPEILLWYRLGDFYETFFEDALIMSKELELTLTGRDAGAKLGRVPLAGIPVKAADAYLEKLVHKNYKVAICDQLEDPKFAKGLVKRGVTRVVTAGTLTESNLLNQNSNNYICAIYKDEKSGLFGFAYTDISTGEFKVTQASLNLVMAELARLNPSEVVAPSLKQDIKPFQIVPDEVINLPDEVTKRYNCSKIPPSVFDVEFSQNNLKQVFKTQSLESYGYSKYPLGFRSAGALVAYIWETLKGNMPKFDRIEAYELSEYMILDAATRKNLELVETLREKNKYGSLLWAIDKTKTNMGARLLKNWICQPLKRVDDIIARQNSVSELVQKSDVRYSLAESLEKIYDIQRLATRMSNGSASPKDFIGLKISLTMLPRLLEETVDLEYDMFAPIREYQEEIADFTQVIENTIVDNPPILLKEGGIIKPNVSGELDYFRDLLTGGEEWLQKFEEEEKERTGIKNLKVGYNKVFGYFIEVTKSNLNMVPQSYVRKQTLTGAERFITDELKHHEDDVLSARFKSTELEYKLFTDFREYSKEFVSKIREIADCIAKADVLTSLSEIAVENNYCKPEIDESDDFIVKNGRHAVLEKILPLGEYVPNDLDLKSKSTNDSTQFMILTGPNMAGKSTYMRQNALIAILAQIGSWVPADYVKLGVVDKVFTRVGASDDLTLGQSTFMVEMIETSFILNTATDRSFILLDEIGRGTSTYDGVAIAWSVAEYIATKVGARCIFATHYHELNVMTKTYPQIKNYRITITENNGEIEFLRKIVQGGASKSYGIQVAKMAGLPSSVVKRSEELMRKMQKDFSNNLATRKKMVNNEDEVPQLSLFGM